MVLFDRSIYSGMPACNASFYAGTSFTSLVYAAVVLCICYLQSSQGCHVFPCTFLCYPETFVLLIANYIRIREKVGSAISHLSYCKLVLLRLRPGIDALAVERSQKASGFLTTAYCFNFIDLL